MSLPKRDEGKIKITIHFNELQNYFWNKKSGILTVQSIDTLIRLILLYVLFLTHSCFQ